MIKIRCKSFRLAVVAETHSDLTYSEGSLSLLGFDYTLKSKEILPILELKFSQLGNFE